MFSYDTTYKLFIQGSDAEMEFLFQATTVFQPYYNFET